jgi:hypothetical protein
VTSAMSSASGIGVSDAARRVLAEVSLLDRQPPFRLSDRNQPSCPQRRPLPRAPRDLSGRRVSSHFLSHDGTTAEANRRRAVVPRPECRHSCHGLCDCRPISARQSNCEFSELADPAVDRDRAAVLLGDDVPGNRQAESGAFAGRLISRNCPRFPNLRCVRVALRAPVDLDLCAGLERAFGDVQTP